jgi:hypothetical protein
MTAAAPATGRSCGSCTLCCKVYEVPPIDNKPRGVWCRHCQPGKGCGIWEQRPEFCRDFHCHWIRDDSFGPEWKPDIAKFVMNERDSGLIVTVDPGHPQAWRREPYLAGLRRIAFAMNQDRRAVQVMVREHLTVLTPDDEIAVGPFGDGVRFHWERVDLPVGSFVRLARVERKAAA